MLLEDLTQARIDAKLAELAADRNKKTRDKPIYVRAHVAFIQGYWRKRAIRKAHKLRVLLGGKR